MKRRYVWANGGASWAALVSLGIIFAAVLSAYANREASKPNMPPDVVAAGTPASRAAVAAANGSGGGIAGCPASSCVGGDCTLTQSLDTVTNGDNQVACGIADVGTTPNGWARCYNLVNEGVPVGQSLTINSVTFGVQQATIDGINIDVVLYVDSDGCPPVQPGVDADVLASQSLVVNMADVGSMITVEFPAGPVVAAGSDLIVEIVSVDDGTVPPVFFFRAMSNANGQCGPSYLRTPNGDCALAGWTDVADIGFPDAHLVQVISATVGVTPSGACCFGDESCQFLNEAACNAAGGIYQGDFTECGGGGAPVTYESFPNVLLPDNDPAGVSDTITVPDSAVITDVDVALQVTHTWVGDLCVTLVHQPTGTTVDLIQRMGEDPPAECHLGGPFGCLENNFNIVLDDGGDGGLIEDQCVANLSSPPGYVPNNPLAAFNTLDSAGDWTLTVSDNALADFGSFDSWSLIITSGDGAGPCDSLCAWDLDGSGVVGILDLLALLAAWGPQPPGHPADFDGDGTVGILDLLTLLANWGACP